MPNGDVNVVRLLSSRVTFISATSLYLLCVYKMANYHAAASEGCQIATSKTVAISIYEFIKSCPFPSVPSLKSCSFKEYFSSA